MNALDGVSVCMHNKTETPRLFGRDTADIVGNPSLHASDFRIYVLCTWYMFVEQRLECFGGTAFGVPSAVYRWKCASSVLGTAPKVYVEKAFGLVFTGPFVLLVLLRLEFVGLGLECVCGAAFGVIMWVCAWSVFAGLRLEYVCGTVRLERVCGTVRLKRVCGTVRLERVCGTAYWV